MDCEKAIYRVYHYLDGELTVWSRWSIRRHLDKCPPCAQGYDFEFEFVRTDCADRGLDDVQIPKCRPRKKSGRLKKKTVPLGLRWPVERTNSWFSNFGQLRRNTDRRTHHRHAQLNLAIALLLAAKLIDWAKRWSPIR